MKTVLSADALDSPIHEGDLLLDGSGRLYLVGETENSFLRQGIVRVFPALRRRGMFVPKDAHTYSLTKFAIVVKPTEDLPDTPAGLRSLFEKLSSERENKWRT